MDNSILGYDKTFDKIVDGEKISYGVLYGNNKIVFIKVGADGNIRGYKNKYLKMACRAHTKTGATVICASNPYIVDGHISADREMILRVIAELNCPEYEISFFGTSDGAYHNLSLAKEFSESLKVLCVNTSTFDFEDLKEKLLALPKHVNVTLVYGDRDDEYCYIPGLESMSDDCPEIITVQGADHEFTGMLDEYISLIDLLCADTSENATTYIK